MCVDAARDFYWRGASSKPKQSQNYFAVPLLTSRDASSRYRATCVRSPYSANMDSVTDTFHLSAAIPIPASSSIKKLDCLIFFRSQLSSSAKIVTENVLHISHDSGVAGSGLLTSGSMAFKQTNPFPVKGGYVTLHSGTELLDAANINSASEGSVKNILQKVSGRNFTMTYDPDVSYWSPKVSRRAGRTSRGENKPRREHLDQHKCNLFLTV